MSDYTPNPYGDSRTSQAQSPAAAAFRESGLNSPYLLPQSMAQYMPSGSPSPDPRLSYGLNPHLQQANALGMYGFATPTMFPSATMHYGDQLLPTGDKTTPFSMAGSQAVLPGIHNLYNPNSSLHGKGSADVHGFGTDQSAVQQGLLRGTESSLDSRQQRAGTSQSLRDAAATSGVGQTQGQRGFNPRDPTAAFRSDSRALSGVMSPFGDHTPGDQLSPHYGMNMATTSGATASGSCSPITSSTSHQGAGGSGLGAYPSTSMSAQQQQKNAAMPSSTLPAESTNRGLGHGIQSPACSQPNSSAASPTQRRPLEINVGSLISPKSRSQEQGKLEKIRAHTALSHRGLSDPNNGMPTLELASGGYAAHGEQSLKRPTDSAGKCSNGNAEKKMRLWPQGNCGSMGEGGTGSLPSMEALAKGVSKDGKSPGGNCATGSPSPAKTMSQAGGYVKQEPISSPPPPGGNAAAISSPNKLGCPQSEEAGLVPKYDPDVSQMRSDSDNRRYVCSYCHQKFCYTESLQIHIGKDHSGLKLQSCLACQKIYENSELLEAHLKVHTEKCPFKCKLCGKSFGKPAQLKRHMRTHNPDGRFHCATCRIHFMSQKCWDQHMQQTHPQGHDQSSGSSSVAQRMTPTGEQKVHCGVCGDHFTEIDDLQNHMKVHLEEQAHECLQCGEKFSDALQLKDHKRVHNSGSSARRNHHCQVCHKSFTVPGSLSRHMLIHSDLKPFQCKDCGKQFRSSSNLQSHSVIHSGQRDHKCVSCNKAFSRPDSLLRHMRTHSGTKPHACDICPKSFAERNHLVNHLRTHTGDRPYTCPSCKKTFSRSDSLNRHVLTHSGKKPGKKQAKEAKQDETCAPEAPPELEPEVIPEPEQPEENV